MLVKTFLWDRPKFGWSVVYIKNLSVNWHFKLPLEQSYKLCAQYESKGGKDLQ